MSGELVLAVAGSRKTQSIIDACVAAPANARILVVTYTVNNQLELRRRLAAACPAATVDVVGWFTFLLHNIVRPYLPFMFPGQRVAGMDNESAYQQYVGVEERRRYFTSTGLARRVHLANLATLLVHRAGELPLRRLEQLYDRMFIDEVQDLGGYDLEVLQLLLGSAVPLTMVGDVRQAILSTSPEERKHKQFRNMRVWHWFQEQERKDQLRITQRRETWRCHPDVAAFADDLFAPTWGFEPTVSRNSLGTGHDGLFLIRTEDVDAYVEEFAPQPLRWDARAAKAHDHLEFLTFGTAKGLTRQRVLIFPTEKMRKLLQKGEPLEPLTAAKLYVGVTRAEQSVAFVLDRPGQCAHPYWSPPEVRPS
ncbi:UvrD-helicase domain-containing protein [Curtobacterium sp. Arg-1]|uniref:UvrD-helicase domain-containing protein n=1 Tax=Curtobacterium sp. Arg-1 TaxID=2935040 RepID=UPI0021D91DFC|nr:UvrD-helicase domain-containing protein [Curtobacterium sp. Arg-1]UXZ57968.1 UvrD-helicase domain-containing protein [Curtobacterium sp. Arg-1]